MANPIGIHLGSDALYDHVYEIVLEVLCDSRYERDPYCHSE